MTYHISSRLAAAAFAGVLSLGTLPGAAHAEPDKPECIVPEQPGNMIQTGKVKWFNDKKGFGFITPDAGGRDVFAHVLDIQCRGYDSLDEGQEVVYEVKHDPKGSMAVKIWPR